MTCNFLKTFIQCNLSFPSKTSSLTTLQVRFSFLYSPFSCKALKHVQLTACIDICLLRPSLILFPSCSEKFFFQLSLDWWDHVGVLPFWGSRFSRLPQATNSSNSGGKPGLYLQWEIVERILIHDQSLIHKVLGHLGIIKYGWQAWWLKYLYSYSFN